MVITPWRARRTAMLPRRSTLAWRIGLAEPELGEERLADLVSVQQLDLVSAAAQRLCERIADGGLAGRREPGEPDDGASTRRAN
jgi:hypothetical protein